MKHPGGRVFLVALTGALALAGGCIGGSADNDCNDGADNDGDGLFDSEDPGCEFNGNKEAPDPDFPACNDGVDNDGDGLIDTADPGCRDINDDDEYNAPIAECRDGIDNDGDGNIDFPNDPGCSLSLENSEEDDCPDGPSCPACANGVDEDDDGVFDYPDDLGCSSASDRDEFNADPTICGANVPLLLLPPDGVDTGNAIAGGPNELISDGCGGSGSETVYEITIDEPTALEITTDFAETTLDTVLYFRSDCRMTDTELGCNDDDGVGVSTLTLDRVEPGDYYIVVDAFNSASGGDYKVQVTQFTPRGEECDPGAPTCAPGLVCRFLDDAATTETCEFPECSDGLDNDDDGLTDFPDEPGCLDNDDNDEGDSCPGGGDCPQCSNDSDDDSDGLTDYPNDPGCGFAADDNEIDECIPGIEVIPLDFGTTTGTTSGSSSFDPSCSFGNSSPEDIHALVLDRDLLSLTFSTRGSTMDTITSVRLDTCDSPAAEIACADPGGGGESVTLPDPAQGTYHVFVDGNFSSGDYELETTGIIPAGDPCVPGNPGLICQTGFYCDSGTEICELAACNDTNDNDGDGDGDYPEDPGCSSPSDNDETDGCPSTNCPQCANQSDDDGDGLTDYPNDPGCLAAGDDNELDCDGEMDEVTEITGPTTTGTTVGLSNDFIPTCDTSDGPEAVHTLDVPGRLNALRIDTEDSALDTLLYVKAEDCTNAELACNDEGPNVPFGDSQVDLTNVDPGRYFIFVDTDISPDDYVLHVDGTIGAGEPCDSTQVASGMFTCESGYICDGSTCVEAACNDGVNNDGDGFTDYPDDPGCDTPSDDDESDSCPGGAGCPECGNGDDDDNDSQTDFPDDPGCEAASDNLELDPCVPGVPIQELSDAGTSGTTPPSSAGSDFTGSCHSSTLSTEDVYAYENTRVLQSLTFSTEGSAGDTVTHVRFDMCDQAGSEVGCENVQSGGEAVTVQSPQQGYYYVFVDGDFISDIDYVLDVFGEIAGGESCVVGDDQFVCTTGFKCSGSTCVPVACSNGTDDDGDGLTDDFDPGCADANDDTEEPDPTPLPQCADMSDNDGDGFTDYPDDLGCERASDDLELNCQDSDPVVEVSSTPETGSTSGATNDFVPSCSTSSTAPEIAHHIVFPGALDSLTVDTCGSSYDTVLYVKGTNCESADLACDDDGPNCGLDSELTMTDVAAGEYFFLVDGYSGNSGSYELNIDAVIKAGEACDMAQVSAGIASCGGGTSCTSGMCQ